jgi:hypothetical protein
MHAGLRHLLMSGVPPIADLRFDLNVLQLGGASYNTPSAIPGFTFARASEGRSLDGTLNFASGVPRIVPGLGILVEEARQNSIRNGSMAGAAAGAPGTAPTNWSIGTNANGLSREIVGIGTDAATGQPYIDQRFFGTTTGAQGNTIKFEAANQIAATNGQVHTVSAFLAVVGGSTANVGQIRFEADQNNSGGSYLGVAVGTDLKASLTSTPTRFAAPLTVNQALAAYIAPYIIITNPSGVAIDITLRIVMPQCELGSFATSPIVTTGAASTRAADVVRFSNGSTLLAVPHTLVASVGGVPSFTASPLIMSSTGDVVDLYMASGGQAAVFAAGATPTDLTTATTVAVNTAFKAGYSTSGSARRVCLNGGAVVSDAQPTAAGANMWLGCLAGSSRFLNGYLGRVQILGSADQSAQLQGRTA